MNPLNSIELEEVVVIIATRDEGKYLRDCIRSVLQACHSQASIVVVNDGSQDSSSAILKEFEQDILVLHTHGKGPGHARNVALCETKQPWVAFTDGDCIVSPSWLTSLFEGIQEQPCNIAAIGGIQKIHSQATKLERWIGEFLETVGFVSDYLHKDTGICFVKHNPTCNVLYSRQALDAAHGFDEHLWPCEDLDLDIRLGKLGYSFLFSPKAVVEHHRPTKLVGFIRMMHRYGFGHAQLFKKYGWCTLFQKMAFGALFAGLLWFWGMVYYFVGWACLSLLTVVVSIFFLFIRTKSIKKTCVIFVFLVISGVPWLFGFYFGLLGKQRIAIQHE